MTVIVLVLSAATFAAAQAPAGDKHSRTPAQRKIDSQLLQEIARVGTPAAESSRPGVKVDRQGRALVDIRAEVTPAMQRTIRRLGGSIVSSSPAYRSVVAWVPLSKLEELAGGDSVHSIIPAPEPTIHK